MKVLIGKKIGMTRIFKENGQGIAVTVLDVSDNVVSNLVKEGEKVTHIEIGKGKEKKASKPEIGMYKTLKFVPKLKEVFRLESEESIPEIGIELKADIFSEGDEVSVRGTSKGKGFQGVVKRWGFKGGPRTHGQSDRVRAPGSIGERMTPGRVFKGQRMGGHMGNVTQTISGLKVVKVMADENLIAVSGSIPGRNGAHIIIKSKGK